MNTEYCIECERYFQYADDEVKEQPITYKKYVVCTKCGKWVFK